MQIGKYHILFLTICCIAAIMTAGCTSDTRSQTSTNPDTTSYITQSNTTEGISWMTIPITDAVTGKQTSVIELAEQGKPVIIHTFAVWCPACSMQLHETAKLLQEKPGAYTVLGIDIDPREDTAMVKDHVEKNHFVGKYTAAPIDLTRSLIRTVGQQVVQTLPQTIIVCNKTVTYIGDGVFPEAKLRSILSELC